MGSRSDDDDGDEDDGDDDDDGEGEGEGEEPPIVTSREHAAKVGMTRANTDQRGFMRDLSRLRTKRDRVGPSQPPGSLRNGSWGGSGV